MFTRAPPLLPGLTAASVWINDSILNSPDISGSERPFALTIPAVMVLLKSYGLPIARTHSPSRRLSELPIGITGRFSDSTLSSAISVTGSVPTILALKLLLLSSVTTVSEAPSTTWLFVTIYPSGEIITPEPEFTLSLGSV